MSGPDGGVPLVFHHGTPGAAAPLQVIERAVHARGLRLVTTSRPGYGGSTRLEGRRVADVVSDTEAALESLGASRCLVAGWSGGGPHALACAARLPAAIGVVVMAGVAPSDAQGLDWLDGMGEDNVAEFGAATTGVDSLRAFLRAPAEELRTVTAAGVVAALGTLLPEADRAVLDGELAEDLAASCRAALGRSVDGWLDDDLAFMAPWGFELSEIAIPVALWQGSEDLMVPLAHGRWLGTHVPNAVVHLEDGQGHLSIITTAIDRMLDELLATTGR